MKQSASRLRTGTSPYTLHVLDTVLCVCVLYHSLLLLPLLRLLPPLPPCLLLPPLLPQPPLLLPHPLLPQDEGLRFLCSKAQIIDELEATLPRCIKAGAWYPPFVHILKVCCAAALRYVVHATSGLFVALCFFAVTLVLCAACTIPSCTVATDASLFGAVLVLVRLVQLCYSNTVCCSYLLHIPPPQVHPASTYDINLNSVWSGMGLMENNLLNA